MKEKKEQQRQRDLKRWRRQEEQAVRSVRDFSAQRLRHFSHATCSRVLAAVAALGV